ncbi:MAG TPA: alpha-glucan family phosphorylase, partial [Syntrophales bacterium]|nr:alpha-glucan family phosphorylase [Syntrophales bacterium]
MSTERKDYLFEVSWEACNQVGEVYASVRSKIPATVRAFGDRYVLLGPDLKNNPEFEETEEDFWLSIRENTAIKDIPCRFGRWKVPGEPRVILVNFTKKYNKDQLLFQLWEDYGVDSISGGWDYVERVMFGYACGEVIETLHNLKVRPKGLRAVALFHDWVCGAGLLGVKKKVPEAGTVLTLHSTVLGQTLAASGMDIYAEMEHISPQREAAAHNCAARYSLEAACAREADCLTTVSDITALEAKNFLGRSPDVVTPNGIDVASIPDLAESRAPALRARERILAAAARFLRRPLPASTRILMTSGRYEFHNKGVDVFLQALGRLDRDMTGDQSVLALLCLMGGHMDLVPSLQAGSGKTEGGPVPIATHRLSYEASDPILETCSRLGLKNGAQNRVSVIFNPACLDGHDGLFDMTYHELLSGCDLGVFPSYYEPWGYSPHECAAYAVPAVTVDQAGFGPWVLATAGESRAIRVLRRRGLDTAAIVEGLYGILSEFVGLTDAEVLQERREARRIAVRAGWETFFPEYLRAFERAMAGAQSRAARLGESREEMRHVFSSSGSSHPHFRTFTAVVNLPAKIARLRELAYNLWWSWNPEALDLFSLLDPKLWEQMGNNPVRMLETVSPERLSEAAENESYANLYGRILQRFDDYMGERGLAKAAAGLNGIRWSAPVAYFSTEYGIHESLPIYSGGLGVLSGDTLKTASDLNIPMVGVGLLYKCGYFSQTIDKDGIQQAEYVESDFSNMPVQIVQDDRGNEVQISIELPGRTLYACIWEVKVGRISLYLLDTDVARNTAQDRKITDRLYTADQRTRIEQEILLGMGGVRLLEKLGIRPRVWHINEGHSAFLLLERVSKLMAEEGLSFDEASEVVRGGTVFTTHTPVEAGNERFSKDLMEYYFSGFVKRIGITWSQFSNLGRKEIGEDRPFFMTNLALTFSHRSNAVSRLHGAVARRMWRDVWKGFHDSDIPIQYVTNGVHMLSWVAPRMKEVLDTYLGLDWDRSIGDPKRWKRVHNIPDSVFWRVRYELKQNLVNYLREHISRHGAAYGYSKTWREEVLGRMNPAALWIGFARRFAPYKRADLLFSDLDRLERILGNETRPVHVVFAGKAHPNDQMGKDLVRRVIEMTRDERFRGKIFFIEDYGIESARWLVQGVDVWLNNPRRPLEASGTSGMKVAINGAINLSVSDGWWAEGYDGTNGWVIGPVVRDLTEEIPVSDEADAGALFAQLEESTVPLFYDRDPSGIPQKWIHMAKRSMETLVPRFNTERMLLEYYAKMYLPAAEREQDLVKDGFRLAKEVADWKRKVPMRFSATRLLEVSVEGITGDCVFVGNPFVVSVRVDPGKLEPEEILAELVIGRRDGQEFIGEPDCVPLTLMGKDASGILTFTG